MNTQEHQDQVIGRPMEILLVEDSLMDAHVTINALREGLTQHRLTLIRDGAEALEFVHQSGRFAKAPRPDLILLDLMLPKKCGTEVLDELKADYSLKKIPVVVLTASEDEADKVKCQMLHVDAFITKPVNLDKFLGVVKQLKRFWLNDVILPSLD
ncbi:MAG: response regulator [Planctomycetaceae bacterium]|nr:response regulator [Planctomycetaceae bacterium]